MVENRRYHCSTCTFFATEALVATTTALVVGSVVWWLSQQQQQQQQQRTNTDRKETRSRRLHDRFSFSRPWSKEEDASSEEGTGHHHVYDTDERNSTSGIPLTLQHPYVQRRISDRLSYHHLSDEDNDSNCDGSACSDDDDIFWSNNANWHHFEGYDRDGNRRTNSTSSSATGTTPPTAPTCSTAERASSAPSFPPPLSSATTTTSTSLSITRTHRNAARQRYNTRILPPKVLLVRHGQSMGNVNESLYATISDNAMPLTPLGWEQARAAGRHLQATVLGNTSGSSNHQKNRNIHFIVSPYVRTWETLHGILAAWVDPRTVVVGSSDSTEQQRLAAWYAQLHAQGLSWHEDPRIREQDFGNFQNPQQIRTAKKERHRFGAFYYRFPHGESASDVYDRVSTFLDSLWRSFDVDTSRNYVLVTHGISIRVILARYYRYSIDQFHVLANPKNCECVALEHDGKGKLMLSGRYELVALDDDEDDGGQDAADVGTNEEDPGQQTETKRKKKKKRRLGYRHYRQLRVLPPTQVHTVHARMMHYVDVDADGDATPRSPAAAAPGTCP